MQTQWYGQPSDFVTTEAQRSHSALYDFVKDILLPAAPVVGMFLSWHSPWRLGAFLIATVFLGSLGLYPRIKTALYARRERVRDTCVTKAALPELQHLAKNFVEFVDNRQQDTLHWIVESDLCQGNGQLLAKMPIPPLSLWSELAGYFANRTLRHSSQLDDLRTTMMEFYHLVGSYNNLCVTPVFERLPKELESALTPKVKGKLNLFQQRFASFLKEYENFVNGLEESRPSCHGLPRPYSSVWPKPLT
jgi:hypothetical protein